MSRTITYRVKTPAGPWQRAVIDDTALPQTISGLVGDETYEVDTGKGTLVDVTTTVSFTLEVFTGTPVAEGSGVFLLEITSPSYLASYDAGEVEGAGAYRYDTDDLATGPIILYPGTLNAETYADGDSITPGNPPFGVGSQVPDITFRVVSDTPSTNTEVFNGATLNFDTTGREGEELSVRAVLTDDNGSTEATIATFTVAAPAAWVPTDLGSKLVLWLDPSDLTKQFQDVAKTTAVTATGQPVRAVEKTAGTATTDALAAGGGSPGEPEITISGSDYYWTFSDPPGDTFRILSLPQTTTDEVYANLRTSDTSGVFIAGNGASNWAGLLRDADSGAPQEGAGTPSYRVNGSPISSPTRDDLHTNWSTGTWNTIGITNLDTATSPAWDTTHLMFYTAGDSDIAGDLGDVIITQALTTEERTSLEAWLAARRP